jgi:hypothetical protein
MIRLRKHTVLLALVQSAGTVWVINFIVLAECLPLTP